MDRDQTLPTCLVRSATIAIAIFSECTSKLWERRRERVFFFFRGLTRLALTESMLPGDHRKAAGQPRPIKGLWPPFQLFLSTSHSL